MTAVPTVVTLIAVGDAGVGVPAVTVVIAAGALARLVWAKLNGPPKPPIVIFCTLTRGRVLVKTQVKSDPATTLPAGIVSTLPEKEPITPTFPVTALLASVQLAAVRA